MRDSFESDNKSVRIDDDSQSQRGISESLYVPTQTQVINKDEDKESNLSEEREINIDSNKNSINLNSKNQVISNDDKNKESLSFTIIENKEKELKKSKIKGNIISSEMLEKKNNILNLEIDIEKSFKEEKILYEISTKIENKNYNLSEKNILCCRSFEHFKLFYNCLKIRYPHYIFPVLASKDNNLKLLDLGQWITSDIKTFSSNIKQNESLKRKRIELKYFINQINNNFDINEGEELRKFLREIIFDEQYFRASEKFFDYPESEKIKNNALIEIGLNYFNYFLGKKIDNDRINSKKLLIKGEKLKNKLKKYNLTFDEIKKIFSFLKKENEEKKNLCKNLSFLKTENFNDENNINKKNFIELIEINKAFDFNKYDRYLKSFEDEIFNPLDFCILNLKGEQEAIERYKKFLEKYYKIINYKVQEKDNKKIIEEQIKIKKDIDLYEETLINEIKRVDKNCTKIYNDTIHKLYLYIRNSTEEFISKYNNSFLNKSETKI